mmetsp:Transcript_14040/g.24604  ORF Transcript_14040/g.24604 Transcript_14040/m.24604 type:complete len:96 (-) Transcript_14040:5-292(-)
MGTTRNVPMSMHHKQFFYPLAGNQSCNMQCKQPWTSSAASNGDTKTRRRQYQMRVKVASDARKGKPGNHSAAVCAKVASHVRKYDRASSAVEPRA